MLHSSFPLIFHLSFSIIFHLSFIILFLPGLILLTMEMRYAKPRCDWDIFSVTSGRTRKLPD